MVDVGAKEETERVAVAEGHVEMEPETLARILEGGVPKGDVLATARIAGIQAAKRTPDLVPLCHPIRLTSVEVEIEPKGDAELHIRATARARDRTGVEMEALAAVTGAALTVYDMVKGIDRGVSLTGIRLVEKSGGRSGRWIRGEE
jgi:cyclic pyranopterin phosphate synthase